MFLWQLVDLRLFVVVHGGERRIHCLIFFRHIEDFFILLQIASDEIEQGLLLNIMGIALLDLNELLLKFLYTVLMHFKFEEAAGQDLFG